MLESIFMVSFGYILAFIVSLIALLCWKKALSYHALWVETVQKLELAKHKINTYQKNINKKEELIIKKNDIINQYSQDLNKYKAKEKELNIKLENLQNEYNKTINKEELKSHNLSKEIDILTKQIKELETNNKTLQTQLAYLKNSIDEQIKNQKQPLEDTILEWKNKFKVVEGENEHLKKEIIELKKLEEKVNTIPKLKHKIVELHHLYQTMKGLKELAEERNYNWESALKKFSRWILRNTDSKYLSQENPPLGPMVADALEIIGEQLLYDEYSSKYSQPHKTFEKNVNTNSQNYTLQTSKKIPYEKPKPNTKTPNKKNDFNSFKNKVNNNNIENKN